MRYRQEPVEVDAVLVVEVLHDAAHHWNALPAWLIAAYESGGIVFAPSGVYITTPQAKMLAEPGDWIIHLGTEIHPCQPGVFREKYEPVPSPEAES